MFLSVAPFHSCHDKIKGGLYGLLVGDAMGHPYEFLSKQAIPPKDQINMLPTKGYGDVFNTVPSGTWSGDGAQNLALID